MIENKFEKSLKSRIFNDFCFKNSLIIHVHSLNLWIENVPVCLVCVWFENKLIQAVRSNLLLLFEKKQPKAKTSNETNKRLIEIYLLFKTKKPIDNHPSSI